MKRRKNITIDSRIEALARQIQDLRAFGDFSSLIEQLIREEWERRNGPMRAPTDDPKEHPSAKRVAEGIAQRIAAGEKLVAPPRPKHGSRKPVARDVEPPEGAP